MPRTRPECTNSVDDDDNSRFIWIKTFSYELVVEVGRGRERRTGNWGLLVMVLANGGKTFVDYDDSGSTRAGSSDTWNRGKCFSLSFSRLPPDGFITSLFSVDPLAEVILTGEDLSKGTHRHLVGTKSNAI